MESQASLLLRRGARGSAQAAPRKADAARPPKINTEREMDFRTAVEQSIRRQGTVTQPVEGRIVRK